MDDASSPNTASPAPAIVLVAMHASGSVDMPTQLSQPVGWRSNLKAWLGAIENARQLAGHNFLALAQLEKQRIPKSLWILVLRLFAERLAVWFVRQAVQDLSTELELGFDTETVDALAMLIVTAM